LHLRMLPGTEDVPVSVEWSVPCEGTVFHLGVHNLPASEANRWMEEFAKFTAKANARRLGELFGELNANPSVLIVLNHPFWDADGAPAEAGASFAPQGTVYGAAAPGAGVILQARKSTTLVVRGPGGAVIFAGLLKPGEAWRAPATPGLIVDVGGPRSVEVFVAGVSRGRLIPAITPVDRLGRP